MMPYNYEIQFQGLFLVRFYGFQNFPVFYEMTKCKKRLTLSMFFPKSKNLFIKEKRSIRIAFANSTYEEIIDLFKRLKNFVL